MRRARYGRRRGGCFRSRVRNDGRAQPPAQAHILSGHDPRHLERVFVAARGSGAQTHLRPITFCLITQWAPGLLSNGSAASRADERFIVDVIPMKLTARLEQKSETPNN